MKKNKPKNTNETMAAYRYQDAQKQARSPKPSMKSGSKGPKSVMPKATDETFSKCAYPGAKELASPSAKAPYADLRMNVDGKSESYRATAPAKQRGGHNKG